MGILDRVLDELDETQLDRLAAGHGGPAHRRHDDVRGPRSGAHHSHEPQGRE